MVAYVAMALGVDDHTEKWVCDDGGVASHD